MRDNEDFIWLFTFTHEMCDQLKNSKAQKNVLSFTNYRDKAYNFIQVFLVKDKSKRHLINRCWKKNMLRDGL